MHSAGHFARNAAAASCFFAVLSLIGPLAADAANGPPSSDSLPRRALLGVTVSPSPDNHLRIDKFVPGSAAEKSELKIGDILLSINGTPMDSVPTLLAT